MYSFVSSNINGYCVRMSRENTVQYFGRNNNALITFGYIIAEPLMVRFDSSRRDCFARLLRTMRLLRPSYLSSRSVLSSRNTLGIHGRQPVCCHMRLDDPADQLRGLNIARLVTVTEIFLLCRFDFFLTVKIHRHFEIFSNWLTTISIYQQRKYAYTRT